MRALLFLCVLVVCGCETTTNGGGGGGSGVACVRPKGEYLFSYTARTIVTNDSDTCSSTVQNEPLTSKHDPHIFKGAEVEGGACTEHWFPNQCVLKYNCYFELTDMTLAFAYDLVSSGGVLRGAKILDVQPNAGGRCRVQYTVSGTATGN